MLEPALSITPETFQEARWEDILPLYEALATQEIDRSTVEAWLAGWSAFEEALSEASAKSEFAYSQNTAEAAAEAAQKRHRNALARKLNPKRVSSACACRSVWLVSTIRVRVWRW